MPPCAGTCGERYRGRESREAWLLNLWAPEARGGSTYLRRVKNRADRADVTKRVGLGYKVASTTND